MCGTAVSEDPFSLMHVSNWFVTEGQVKLWHDDSEYCDDDELITYHEGYKKRKAQKLQIKEELMPIAWHPSRWWDCCIPEDD